MSAMGRERTSTRVLQLDRVASAGHFEKHETEDGE